MKLISFLAPKSPIVKMGVYLENAKALDLFKAANFLDSDNKQYFQSMLTYLEGGEKARDIAENLIFKASASFIDEFAYNLCDIKLLTPLNPLSSIKDFMAFEDHIINCIRDFGLKKLAKLDEWIDIKFGRRRTLAYYLNKSFYTRPAYYKGNPRSVVGSGAEVIIPKYTNKMDYELEFGIFIGKKGRNISSQDAAKYIAGYSIFNDFSARDIQFSEQKGRLGPAKAKDFDTGNAIGPYLVTADEVGDPYNLNMVARINSEEWSRGTTADMYWTFEQLIEYVSQDETIYPGDFFGSGTCSGKQGKGCGLEIGRFLKAGDIVELEVDKLGVLRNELCEGSPANYI